MIESDVSNFSFFFVKLYIKCSIAIKKKFLSDSTEANASLVLMIKMMARIFVQMFSLLILFQAGDVTLSATVNGQCDLCSLNNQLLEEVNDLKKEQSAIKGLIGQIIRPGEA